MNTTIRNEEKNQLIINKIVQDRKNSANKIINQFKYIYNPKLNIKKYLLIRNLLQKRNESSLKITAILKSFIVRKKVQNYLSKIKTNFVITRELSNEKNMQLNVFFGKIIKTFNFEYDPFIEKLAIYIPRNKITKNEYKVNFISKEGTIVIDPSYFTSEENGNFVNIINFARIKKEEIEKAKENARELKFVLMYLKSEGIKFTEKGVEFEKDELGDSTASNSPQLRKMKRRASMSVPFKRMMNFKKLSNLPKPKSILKLSSTQVSANPIRRRTSVANDLKRVSFGSVEFSY